MDDALAVRADEIRWTLEPTPSANPLCMNDSELFSEVLLLREMRSELLAQLHSANAALTLARYEIARLRAELRT